MKLDKKQNRLRRARKARAKISELEVNRLSVHRTPRHIYAQVIGPDGGTVLASASTLEKEVRKGGKRKYARASSAAAMLKLQQSLAHGLPRRQKQPESTRSRSTVRASAIMVAFRLWPMRRAKRDSSFKGKVR